MGVKQHSFNGTINDHDHMSHQHLSNCVWHFRIWTNAHDLSLQHFFDTLNRRFKGELLPFRPLQKFKAEIDALHKAGMVEPVDEFKSNIRYKGNIIGEMFNSIEKEHEWLEREAHNKNADKILKTKKKKK
jgi:hypothetical protein